MTFDRSVIKVAVGLRISNVHPGLFSRACQDRLIEPFSFLTEKGELIFSYVREIHDLEHLYQQGYRIFVVNKALTEKEHKLWMAAKKLGYKLVYDVDDYIFRYPSYSNFNDSKLKVEDFTGLADVITVANERLFYAFQGNGNVRMLGNSFNVSKYSNFQSRKTYDTRKVVITNADKFKLTSFRQDFFSLLKELISSSVIKELHLFADFIPPELEIDGVIYHGFVPLETHRKILAEQNFHLALAPIDQGVSVDDWRFNISKNPFKYFIYGTARIPAIYSDIPFYSLYVKDHFNGMLAQSERNDWFKKIQLLLDDPLLCKNISQNAFQDVKETFDIEHLQFQYMNLFSELLKI